MAVIDKKLIHFTNLATFEQRLNAGEIKDTSIVFIQDAKRIWTHGQYYSSPYTKEEIDQLFVGSNVTLDGYSKNGVAEIFATDTVNSAFGKIEDYLDSLSELNAVLVDTGDSALDPIINDYITSSELNLTLTNYATKNQLNINDTGAKTYTDTVIKNLVNAAPDTLDTLGELATAIKDNQDVIEAINNAITNKVSSTSVTSIVKITQTEYDALETKDPNTLYVIPEES